MDKRDVIEFFNGHAGAWDAELIRDDEIINTILDNAGVCAGKDVLDVACGTGVLMPDYIKRDVNSVTGIDISPEMIKIAREKFSATGVSLICGDVEELETQSQFDCIVVYNAFPHFPQPKRVLEKLSSMLRRGGSLTVAHGMSREQIDRHHSGNASKVSIGLVDIEELAAILPFELEVSVKISDERMYQLVGVKSKV